MKSRLEINAKLALWAALLVWSASILPSFADSELNVCLGTFAGITPVMNRDGGILLKPNPGQLREAIRRGKGRDLGLRMIDAQLDPNTEIAPFLTIVQGLVKSNKRSDALLLRRLRRKFSRLNNEESFPKREI